ncbi:MAG TPA: sulfurtransferase [Vicinamibacterales bacterium]|nr:sulfurtransferase [Vicinamibacterales bacterium]
MAFTTVVSTDDLAAHATDPAWAIVDCRFQLADDTWGEREYSAGHLPRAVYAHLGRDLSGPMNGRNGRHPLPDPDAAARTFGRLGIANGMQVVAYDQDTGSFASRLWWMLRWLGHDAVAVLDGGFAKWTAEHRAVEAGAATPAARRFVGQPRPQMTIDAAEVARLLRRPDTLLLDARAPERYRGDVEPIDRVPGHIPGAANYFFQQNVSDRGVLRSPGELRDQLSVVLGEVPADRVVCYCGSGVTACHNLLALERAGLPGAKLYAGSWSEWSSDPSRPVDRSKA